MSHNSVQPSSDYGGHIIEQTPALWHGIFRVVKQLKNTGKGIRFRYSLRSCFGQCQCGQNIRYGHDQFRNGWRDWFTSRSVFEQNALHVDRNSSRRSTMLRSAKQGDLRKIRHCQGSLLLHPPAPVFSIH
jgi:hypothetical protein